MADNTIYEWPEGLPDPLIDSYSDEGEDAVLRSNFDAGPSKIRPRYSGKPPRAVSMSFVMNQAQRQIIDDFYYVTLNRIGLFNYKDFTLDDAPSNVTIYRFTGVPKYRPYTRQLWEVTLPLERLTEAQGEFLLDFSNGTQGLTT